MDGACTVQSCRRRMDPGSGTVQNYRLHMDPVLHNPRRCTDSVELICRRRMDSVLYKIFSLTVQSYRRRMDPGSGTVQNYRLHMDPVLHNPRRCMDSVEPICRRRMDSVLYKNFWSSLYGKLYRCSSTRPCVVYNFLQHDVHAFRDSLGFC